MFDLDGTLVDSVPDLAFAINQLLCSCDLPEVSVEQIALWVGNGAAMLVRRALAHSYKTDIKEIAAENLEHCLELFFVFYRKCNGKRSQLYSGVLNTLQSLQAMNIKMAVVTNKPAQFTDSLLEQLAIRDYFSMVVSGDTLSVKKPDPEPLLHCAQQLQIDTARCLMVGDSMTDVNAARNAAMQHCCVSYGYSQGADFKREGVSVIGSFTQLVK